MVRLPSLEASKIPRVMSVTESEPGWFGSETDRREVHDVLVGEVWFASGQSNMECPIWGANTRYRDGNGGLLTEMTRLPFVRFAKVGHKWSVGPTNAESSGWLRFEPSSFARSRLSAVAFYYARELHLALDVPIGIVDATWGGTNIDPWTPRSGYAGCDELVRPMAEYPVKENWDPKTDQLPPVHAAHRQPTVLWNGMVASWAPMAMRGFIWYQGCSNGGEPQRYCAKMHALYRGWRSEFQNPGLRMYLVQLAPWRTSWMGLCVAQERFVAEEANAALAVTADVGNFDDIHPNRKEIVAKRLAVHALKRDYGFDVSEDCSPVVRSVAFREGRAVVTFDHVKEFYVYSPKPTHDAAFELCGADGIWHPAKIVNFRKTTDKAGKTTDTDYIDGNEIVLKSELVPVPVHVRHMGCDRSSGIVYNEVSLPLGPFEK